MTTTVFRSFMIDADQPRLLYRTATFLTLLLAAGPTAADDKSFSREVLPILSDRCFHCHGPDESTREGGLRLDKEALAKEDLGGYAAVTGGDLEQSEIWRRITSEDEDELMPPADSHRKPLNDEEREAIRRWILAGAPWGKHWSLERIERPVVPGDAKHPVDAFIREQLKSQQLRPNGPAAPHTQLRRLAFALTGMAPESSWLEQQLSKLQNVSDATTEHELSDSLWAESVEHFLRSPHHAERMAMWWLDAARYSDSDGFQQDKTRENWPWRDWVINAFANNMPFDQFTTEQFAGDLLPEATEEQILATCFHRNHMTNGEGGRDPEESRVDYVIDRVNTMGTVWLGLTLGCTQCHNHKFDPISQQDYYSLSAFFNNIDEDGKAGKAAKPYLQYTSKNVADSIDALKQFLKTCEQQEATERAAAEARFERWLDRRRERKLEEYRAWRTPAPTAISSSEGTTFEIDDAQIIQTSGPDAMHENYRVELSLPPELSQVSGWKIEVFHHPSHVEGKFTRFGNGDFTLTSAKILGKRAGDPSEVELPLVRATADYQSKKDRKTTWDLRYANIRETLNDDARDGWTTEGADSVEDHVGVYELQSPWQAEPGDRLIIVLQQRSTHGHANIARFRISITDEVGDTVRRTDGGSPMRQWLENRQTSHDDPTDSPPVESDSDAPLKKNLLDQFLLGDSAYQAVFSRMQSAKKQLSELEQQAKPRAVMVLKEREAVRPTHVLVRGVWDAKGETVDRGALPAVLDWPKEKLRTRLDLAQWLLDRENPLTARVVVNHLWQIMFGSGLVRTPEDFGLQGELPSHPELLDWLAMELIEHDWDLRHVLRLIATSETFRQSSAATNDLRANDPKNLWYARSPKHRLPSWMLRDNALNVSGLLNRTVGGPPVFPYQPPGVWSEITMGRFRYEPSLGPAQYRRTLYAFWRRSSAPAFLFDTAQRRVCEVGVRRTNTPLHALTLMNHETVLEASRALADSAAENRSTEAGIQEIAVRVLGRRLVQAEISAVQRVVDQARQHFTQHPEDARQFVSVGAQPPVSSEHLSDVAAWMTAANLLLNLDEAISFE